MYYNILQFIIIVNAFRAQISAGLRTASMALETFQGPREALFKGL